VAPGQCSFTAAGIVAVRRQARNLRAFPATRPGLGLCVPAAAAVGLNFQARTFRGAGRSDAPAFGDSEGASSASSGEAKLIPQASAARSIFPGAGRSAAKRAGTSSGPHRRQVSRGFYTGIARLD